MLRTPYGRIAIGGGIAVAALLITGGTYFFAASQEGGGRYYIFWGAALWGGWMALQGLLALPGYLRAQRSGSLVDLAQYDTRLVVPALLDTWPRAAPEGRAAMIASASGIPREQKPDQDLATLYALSFLDDAPSVREAGARSLWEMARQSGLNAWQVLSMMYPLTTGSLSTHPDAPALRSVLGQLGQNDVFEEWRRTGVYPQPSIVAS